MDNLYNISKELVDILIEKGLKITSMESCTGGYFLSCITDIENSSKITDGGYITYSNEAKIACGVSQEIIEEYGVYSKETATEMAKVSKEKQIKEINDKDKLIGVGITGSLTSIDENNEDSKIGQVYYNINYQDGKVSSNEMTLDAHIPRKQMKEFIVKIIMREIINNLKS